MTGIFEPLPYKNMTTYHDIISNDRLSGSSAHFFSVRSFNPQARWTQKKKLGHSGESFPPCSRVLHSQPACHNDLHEESIRKGLVGIFSRFLGCWQAICAQSANTLHSHGWVFQAVDSLSNQASTLPNFETAHLIGLALSLLENTIRDGGSITTLNAKHCFYLYSTLLYLCYTSIPIGMMLRWSKQRDNDRYKDHLDGQWTMLGPDPFGDLCRNERWTNRSEEPPASFNSIAILFAFKGLFSFDTNTLNTNLHARWNIRSKIRGRGACLDFSSKYFWGNFKKIESWWYWFEISASSNIQQGSS